ncbi:MAG: hypothetical protein ACRD68_00365 [Pyrinomonadaceae bacterium]
MACSLAEAEFRERRGGILRKVRDAVEEAKEVEGGYAYRFRPDKNFIVELAGMVNLESQCCPFLRFRMTVEPGGGPIWLEMTGPQGTRDFLASIFD